MALAGSLDRVVRAKAVEEVRRFALATWTRDVYACCGSDTQGDSSTTGSSACVGGGAAIEDTGTHEETVTGCNGVATGSLHGFVGCADSVSNQHHVLHNDVDHHGPHHHHHHHTDRGSGSTAASSAASQTRSIEDLALDAVRHLVTDASLGRSTVATEAAVSLAAAVLSVHSEGQHHAVSVSFLHRVVTSPLRVPGLGQSSPGRTSGGSGGGGSGGVGGGGGLAASADEKDGPATLDAKGLLSAEHCIKTLTTL